MIGGVPDPGPMSADLQERILRVRGSFFTVAGPVSGPPRPGQPNNVASTAGYDGRSPEERAFIRSLYLDQGLTHGALGPFIDPGYHHDEIGTPATDFRADGGERVLRVLEETWAGGIIPNVFIVPDNWKLDETRRAFEPIMQQPAWQAVCHMVTLGWEPSMDRPNSEYVAWFQWLADLFPNAIRCLHMVSDFDAPGNNDDLTPGRASYIGNAGCWDRIAPYLHLYLSQSSSFEHPFNVDPDPRAGGRTDFQQWQDRYRIAEPSSISGRFATGYAGWPTHSAFGSRQRIRVVAAEYGSYSVFWNRRAPSRGYATLIDEAKAWGDAALAAGADGVFDNYNANREGGRMGYVEDHMAARVAPRRLSVEEVNEKPTMQPQEAKHPGRPQGTPRRPMDLDTKEGE